MRLLVAVALMLAACNASQVEPTATTSTPVANHSNAPDAPSASARTARPSPALDLPQIGSPFNATDIQVMMQSSRRPGGVPERLQAIAVAQQVADSIWTYGSTPWATSTAGAFCGIDVCTLELAGTRPGTAGEDLWVFEVRDATVTLVTADLGSLPDQLVEELDALARVGEPAIGKHELSLASTNWLLPPADGLFRLSYRSGAEELSCRLDVTVDALGGTVSDSVATFC